MEFIPIPHKRMEFIPILKDINNRTPKPEVLYLFRRHLLVLRILLLNLSADSDSIVDSTQTSNYSSRRY